MTAKDFQPIMIFLINKSEIPNSRIGAYIVSKNNRQGISWQSTEYKLNAYSC